MDAALLSTGNAYLVMLGYAAAMLGVVWLATSAGKNLKDHYFVADRELGVFPAAASIAVSWIWAPAIFFVGLKAYSQGMAGAFWFIVPNIVCFFTFAFVVKKMRGQFPNFYTLPDYLLKRFGNNRGAHLSSLIVALIIGFVALLFNAFIGAFLLNMLTGIPLFHGIGIMMLIALVYSVWRGFPASVMTDVVQLAVIFVIVGAIVPWTIAASGDVNIADGFAGTSGQITSIFDREVLFTFGIPATLALLAVPLADQMFYHRAAAVPQAKIVKTFIIGGLMFGIVPIMLSLPGFIGAALESAGLLERSNLPPLFISADVVAQFLPDWVLSFFVVMAICALSSTIDSALVALSLIWSQDIYVRYIRPDAGEQQQVSTGRIAIIAAALVAILLAWLLQNFLSGDVLFNFNGAVASAIAGPLLLAVFWRGLPARAFAFSVLPGLAVGIPAALWANQGYYVAGNKDMAACVLAVAIGIPLLTTGLALILARVFKANPTV